MPVSIAQLAVKYDRRTVTLAGGASVEVGALRAIDMDAILRVHRRPVPPMGPDPTAGSRAAPVPREDDPAYRAALDDWVRAIDRAEACVAIDLVTSSGRRFDPGADVADIRAYLAEASMELCAALANADIIAIVRAARPVAGRIEDALGN